tara:strand:+ start:308 stop:454 length:147 start_codon:yes stop_codon:yes gene_type:complete
MIKKEISESIQFLLIEYKRLIKKNEKSKITKDEKEALLKLSKFLGKKK